MTLDYLDVMPAVLIPGVLYAAWIDYTQHRVPNWLNAALAVSGLAAQTVFFGWGGLLTGFLGLLTGFGLLIGPWLIRGMGAGDVKLMAAIGVWLGPWLTLVAFACGAIIGGLTAFVMIVSSRQGWKGWWSLVASETGSAAGAKLLPYGIFVALGAILVVLNSVFGWVPQLL